MLVEDILYVLLGINGKYVNVNHFSSEDHRWDKNIFNSETTRGIDPSLTYLVRRISPIASAYSVVSQYVDSHSRYEYGMTCHALSAAIRSLLKEFVILVAQLEQPELISHRTKFTASIFLHPTLIVYFTSLRKVGIACGKH